MMEDHRKPFDDAISEFRAFVTSTNRPTGLIWLTKDRTRIFGRRAWIFRPNELFDDAHAREFYDTVRTRDSSIKFLGIAELDGRYCSSIEEMPAPPHHPRMFYMSLWESRDFQIYSIQSRLLWWFLGLLPSRVGGSKNLSEVLGLSRGIPNA